MTDTTENQMPNVGHSDSCNAAEDCPGVEFARFEVQPNGGLLVLGDQASLVEYIKPMVIPIKPHARGVLLRKADADKRRFIPVRILPLESGSRLEYFESGGVGIKGDFSGGYMGITETLAKLEFFFTEDHGPVEFKRVFGKEPEPEAVQCYDDQQAVIAARRVQNDADALAKRLHYAHRTGDLTDLFPGEQAIIKREKAAATALWEAEASKHWMARVGAGVVGNPLYQAFIDSVEDVVALAQTRSNAPYFAWHADRCREFAVAERQDSHRETMEARTAFANFCREWAEQNLSDRVARRRELESRYPEVTSQAVA